MSLKQALSFALTGVRSAYQTQANVRRQVVIGLFVLALGILASLPLIHLAILVLTIGIVLATELMNTVVEEIVNLITVEKKEEAKIAKDIAAGMVLLTCAVSVVVGILLFWEPISLWIGALTR